MAENQKWVTAWGNAISIAERRPENYGKNITFRYPVKMLLSGSSIRITLDNFCGTEAVTVTCAAAAKGNGGSSIQKKPRYRLPSMENLISPSSVDSVL